MNTIVVISFVLLNLLIMLAVLSIIAPLWFNNTIRQITPNWLREEVKELQMSFQPSPHRPWKCPNCENMSMLPASVDGVPLAGLTGDELAKAFSPPNPKARVVYKCQRCGAMVEASRYRNWQ